MHSASMALTCKLGSCVSGACPDSPTNRSPNDSLGKDLTQGRTHHPVSARCPSSPWADRVLESTIKDSRTLRGCHQVPSLYLSTTTNNAMAIMQPADELNSRSQEMPSRHQANRTSRFEMVAWAFITRRTEGVKDEALLPRQAMKRRVTWVNGRGKKHCRSQLLPLPRP